MKKKSVAGYVGIGFFVVAFVLIVVAFSTPNWLVSDQPQPTLASDPGYRITGYKLDHLGLWAHCFRSYTVSYDDYTNNINSRFDVRCRWIYNSFMTVDEVRRFLPFMLTTQIFFNFCFIAVLGGAILTPIYSPCCGVKQNQFVPLLILNAGILLFGGIAGTTAIIVFAVFVSCANIKGCMARYENTCFGWSFVLACIGVGACLVASTLFFVDACVQRRKRHFERFTGSQRTYTSSFSMTSSGSFAVTT